MINGSKVLVGLENQHATLWNTDPADLGHGEFDVRDMLQHALDVDSVDGGAPHGETPDVTDHYREIPLLPAATLGLRCETRVQFDADAEDARRSIDHGLKVFACSRPDIEDEVVRLHAEQSRDPRLASFRLWR